MARLALLVVALLAIPVWLGSGRAVLACTGLDATLDAGLRHATSVYYARITDAISDGNGFYQLTLDVQRPVRGNAERRLERAVGAKVCTGLEPGESGLVVLGAKNAFDGDASGTTYDLFYVLGPGYYSRATVDDLLGLPSTDTAPAVDLAPRCAVEELLRGFGLVALFGASFVLARRRILRRSGRA